MVEMISIFSSVISLIASIYLIYIITTQTAKGLRTGFLLLATGILVSVVIHSLVEMFERLNYLSQELLVQIMPVLILTGSLLILAGAYTLYITFKNVKKEK